MALIVYSKDRAAGHSDLKVSHTFLTVYGWWEMVRDRERLGLGRG